LYSSVIHGNLEAVEVLLELRARTDLTDRFNKTALDHVKEIIRNNPTHPFAKKIRALLDRNLAEEDAKNQREQDAQQARQQRAQAEARFNPNTQEQARRTAEQARRAAEQARRAAEEQTRRAAEEQARRVSASDKTKEIKSAVLKNLDSLKIVPTDARSKKLAPHVSACVDSLKSKISGIYDALAIHQIDSASSQLQPSTVNYITQNLQSDVRRFVIDANNTNKLTLQQKVIRIQTFPDTLKDKVDKNDLVALGLERARS
jgi:multidrug efflux pump subunit AcrA (membrane-fusion protein)